jgi:hypothetical protein
MSIQLKRASIIFALIVTFAMSLAAPVFANPHNFAERHPTMTAMAAGVGTTMYLKHRAAWKKAHGEKLNFAERHPYMSGMGVGIVAHHMLKKAAQ